MGALTSHPRFSEDSSNFDHISKKQKLCQPSTSTVFRCSMYPQPKQELPRPLHAPTKTPTSVFSKRTWFRNRNLASPPKLGNSFSNSFTALKSRYAKASRDALGTIRHVAFRESEEVVVLDYEVAKEDVTEGSSVEDVEVEIKEQPVDQKRPISSPDLGLKALSWSLESDRWAKAPHVMLFDSAQKRDVRLNQLSFQIQLKERLLQRHQLLRPQKKVGAFKEDVVKEAFVPLTDADRSEIARAFANSNRRKILVSHEKSNIDITGEMLQCLRPGAWLNDEVINVYLELLKERENREPQKFLKCHFLNTFFYKKLIGGKGGYNFQAVRRWTSQKKLGYHLCDCDKIFVPIHKEIHWCLAVINKKEQKFQYLDSLGGRDDKVMKVLARYYVDEVKDKTEKNIDVSSWAHEFVEDLPEQKNGYDCGVFMIKYTDFYSRGVGLHFKQEHMPYFRQRTAKEILRLKAD